MPRCAASEREEERALRRRGRGRREGHAGKGEEGVTAGEEKRRSAYKKWTRLRETLHDLEWALCCFPMNGDLERIMNALRGLGWHVSFLCLPAISLTVCSSSLFTTGISRRYAHCGSDSKMLKVRCMTPARKVFGIAP